MQSGNILRVRKKCMYIAYHVFFCVGVFGGGAASVVLGWYPWTPELLECIIREDTSNTLFKCCF